MDEPTARPARHSDATLLALEQLQATMNDRATAEERDAWWILVLRIQSSVDSYPRASKADRDAMRRLRDGVTELYGSINRGHLPDYSAALRASCGLQYLLEKQTTGFDGHRLR